MPDNDGEHANDLQRDPKAADRLGTQNCELVSGYGDEAILEGDRDGAVDAGILGGDDGARAEHGSPGDADVQSAGCGLDEIALDVLDAVVSLLDFRRQRDGIAALGMEGQYGGQRDRQCGKRLHGSHTSSTA